MNKKGVTLIEVLIATLVLAGGLFVVNMTWSGNLLRMRKAQNNTNLSLFLEQKMIEVESKYEGKPLGSIPEKENGNFGQEFPDYTWLLESRRLEFPEIFELLLKDENVSDSQTLGVVSKVEKIIQESIKEVRLTISYKTPKGVISETLATYFVEEKKLDLGIPQLPAGGSK